MVVDNGVRQHLNIREISALNLSGQNIDGVSGNINNGMVQKKSDYAPGMF